MMDAAEMEATVNSALEILKDRGPDNPYETRPDERGLPKGFIHLAMGLWLVDMAS
ncbi:unnamed protein product, partial [Scytosiphon promiscuus]